MAENVRRFEVGQYVPICPVCLNPEPMCHPKHADPKLREEYRRAHDYRIEVTGVDAETGTITFGYDVPRGSGSALRWRGPR